MKISLYTSEYSTIGKQIKKQLIDKNMTAKQLADQIGTKVFETKIRTGVAVAEAPAHGESIFEYNPRSAAVQDSRPRRI